LATSRSWLAGSGQEAITYDPTSALLTKLKNARGNAWTWSYTPPSGSGANWNWEECGPGGDCLNARYDWLTGLPIYYTDKRNVTDNYRYDDFDRLSALGYNADSTSGYPKTSINYTYDAGDRVTQMVDTGGGNHSSSGNTQNIQYDLLDNMTQFESPEGTVNYGYQYQGSGQGYYWDLRQSMQLVGQSQVNYTYNTAEQLTEAQQGGLTASIGYDGAARRYSLTLPNGIAINYTYDNDSRITQLAYSANSTSLGALTYSYDSDSRAVGKGGSFATVNLPGAVSNNTYDIANRITKWNGVTGGSDANIISTLIHRTGPLIPGASGINYQRSPAAVAHSTTMLSAAVNLITMLESAFHICGMASSGLRSITRIWFRIC
jgi:hypothetical protein